MGGSELTVSSRLNIFGHGASFTTISGNSAGLSGSIINLIGKSSGFMDIVNGVNGDVILVP
ncbi:MAG: hypothetical protein ACKO7W_07440 [Elainella sp.]